MSWLGNCTSCGQPTVSTRDPGYRDADYVRDESGFGVRHVWCPVKPSSWPGPSAMPRAPQPPGSPIEQKFLAACEKLGAASLAGLVPQYPVAGYRIDFALPDRKIGIELDGFASHSSTADIENDRRRQRDLEGRGWYLIRFGGREVHRDADYCAQQAAWLIEHAREGGS